MASIPRSANTGAAGRRGAANLNWRGGRTVTQHGYVMVKVPDNHPLAHVNGYAYEHRIVAEQVIGRPLNPGEIIHHRDGNKQNNSPANIAVLPSIAHHALIHRNGRVALRAPGEENPSVPCRCGCGTVFLKYDPQGRPRVYVTGHNGRHPEKGRYGS